MERIFSWVIRKIYGPKRNSEFHSLSGDRNLRKIHIAAYKGDAVTLRHLLEEQPSQINDRDWRGR